MSKKINLNPSVLTRILAVVPLSLAIWAAMAFAAVVMTIAIVLMGLAVPGLILFGKWTRTVSKVSKK